MGLDDAIARANEAEAQRSNDQRDQQAFAVKRKRVVDDLCEDFVKRVERAGVRPLAVLTTRARRTFMQWGNQFVEVDTGLRAWVVDEFPRDDHRGYAKCLAVTEDGEGIHVLLRDDQRPITLSLVDSPSSVNSYGRKRPAWIDAAEFDKQELQKVADDTSTMLAAALKKLGAI